MASSLVGQVCHEVFQSENKRKTERKLFIREHQLKCRFLFSASLSSLPSSELLFHLFHCSFFLTPSVSLSLYLSCSLSSFFSLSPLSAAVTDFFLPRLKYEYFRAKKLKGNNEMAPKLNYTPFPESQKKDFTEWWAHRCHVGVSFSFSHTHKLVVSCFCVTFVIFPQILLLELLNQAAVR